MKTALDRYGKRRFIEGYLELQRRIGCMFQRSHHQRGALVLEPCYHRLAARSQSYVVRHHLKHAFTINLQRQYAFKFPFHHNGKGHESRDRAFRWHITFKIRNIILQRIQRFTRNTTQATVSIGTGDQVGSEIGFMSIGIDDLAQSRN